MAALTMDDVAKLPEWPSEAYDVNAARYALKAPEAMRNWADGPDIKATVWFRSPALTIDTIGRLQSLQLFTMSHDQGFSDDHQGGNWNWFEVCILESVHATEPRVKDGIQLTWFSHENPFLTTDDTPAEGAVFAGQHEMLGLLEEGNALGVRLVSRFGGWELFASTAYLAVKVGQRTIVREAVEYAPVVEKLQTIEAAISEINAAQGAAFVTSVPPDVYRAGAFNRGGDAPLRVLSLDGGGVRGLSALRLLQATLAGLDKQPHEVFDMIGGTSTGGFIAIMLGRLKMPVQECIDRYKAVMKKVFYSNAWTGGKTGRLLRKGEYYDAADLEREIKALVRDKLGDEDALLHDPLDRDPACKVFCMATRQESANNHGPIFLRSYLNPLGGNSFTKNGLKIWQAARATSAAPAYFAPMTIDDVVLVDGGLGANNPLGWLWTEVLAVYGPARSTDCFLSVGTGIGQNAALPKPGLTTALAAMNAFAGIATNSELINVLFRTLLDAYAPHPLTRKYFRLNVSTAIGEVKDIQDGITAVKDPENYVAVGDLDDVDGADKFAQRTDAWIASEGSEVIRAAHEALQLSVAAASGVPPVVMAAEVKTGGAAPATVTTTEIHV